MHGAGEEVYGRDAFQRESRGGKFLGVTRKALGIAGHVSEPLGAVWKRKKVCKCFCGSFKDFGGATGICDLYSGNDRSP